MRAWKFGGLDDAVFIGACMVLCVAALVPLIKGRGTSGAQEDVVGVGTPVFEPFAAGAAGPEVVLLFRTNCHYCQESLSFYRTLSVACERAGVKVRIFTTEPEEVVKAALRDAGLGDPSVSTHQRFGPIRATPAIVTIDNENHVSASWVGKLSLEQEQAVLREVRRLGKVAAGMSSR